MKIIVRLSIIVALVVYALCAASPASSQLVGFSYTDRDNIACNYNPLWACAPESDGVFWKAFFDYADFSGIVNSFRVNVVSPSATVDIGWAVYADNGNKPGAMIAGGYFEDYQIVIGDNVIPANILTGEVLAGGKYWLTMHTNLGAGLIIQRGRLAVCSQSTIRKMTNYNNWNSIYPPPGDRFINTLAGGCYAWDVE